MSTLLLTHPVCLEHDTGALHPECADRLKAVLNTLARQEFCFLARDVAPHATVDQLLRVHPLDHVEHVMNAVPRSDSHHHIDSDTVLSRQSGEAALRAAGAVVAGVDAVARGEVRNVFCAVRPPGHHAERAEAMGFCVFNNVAVGAMHARAEHGIQRVAIVDFDVHHGNGTQHIFYDDPDVMYCSTHQNNAFPFTGTLEQTGVADNMVNVPLPPGTGSEAFRAAYTDTILPKLEAFQPGIILISAGFDAHASDPLAHLRLATDDFHWVTARLLEVAQRVCGNKVVSVLEGGYDLTALAASAAAHVRALMGS